MFYCADLDGTLIDSDHRKLTLPNGSLDLDHWVENCTARKIMQDTLLPLVEMVRKAYFSGIHQVLIVTARVLSDHDYEFFMVHNIPFHVMLDRPLGCTMADAELKDIQLRLYAHSINMPFAKFAAQALVIDDNQDVLTRMESIGITTMDAIQQNRILAG
jgi:hypothetical protein